MAATTRHHAAVLSPEDITRLLTYVETQTRFPLRNRVIILLGLAGFRSQEMAALTWADVAAQTTPYPIPPTLKDALTALQAARPSRRPVRRCTRGTLSLRRPRPDYDYVLVFAKGNTDLKSRAMSIRFLFSGKGAQQGWFHKLGMEGCSSHSLRRTYLMQQTETQTRRSHTNTLEYRTICFQYHDRQCIVCGEREIVDVHHRDRNPLNNVPENLIPLCPTHHRYCHTRRLQSRIEARITAYLRQKEWSTRPTDDVDSMPLRVE